MIDWSQCPDVESVPDRCGGAWVVKDSRVMVQGILDNAADASADEIADMFELPVDVVERILAHVLTNPLPPCPACGCREARIRTATYKQLTLFGTVEDTSDDFFVCLSCGQQRDDCFPDGTEPDDEP